MMMMTFFFCNSQTDDSGISLSLSLSLSLDLFDMDLFSSAFSQLRKRQT
jgi:hypothetical protein